MIEEKNLEAVQALETIKLVKGKPKKVTTVGTSLDPSTKEKIVRFLRKNLDIFAWSHEDMPSFFKDIIQHHLNVNPKRKQVQQRRRVFSPKRNKAIMDKVDKLLADNLIREVYYQDWLVNIVMVKKAEGKWRTCGFHGLE